MPVRDPQRELFVTLNMSEVFVRLVDSFREELAPCMAASIR
jgi:hypothetical protein